MNAAETIAAAIEKLEELKAGITPGRWSYYFEPWGDVMSEQEPGLGVETMVASEMSAHDGTLVVVLHRTIDAQLDTMRAALEHHTNDRSLVWTIALTFARAIVGEVTS